MGFLAYAVESLRMSARDWSPAHSMGALTFFAVAMLGLTLVLQRQRWRRLWFGQEDPRALALFRIVFSTLTLCNVNGLWDLYSYLFTDEGLFLGDTARMVRARWQFAGFGNGIEGDPVGFIDGGAFLRWLGGPNHSLLLLWSTPTAFWIHWAAFQVAMIMLIVGYRTRTMAWIAWFLFHSIILRNRIFWEGTETISRCLFFYLAMSRCGHAYSVDNWLRRRRAPGEPLHRPIPRWPRLLVMLQLAAVYTTTGLVKTGAAWREGDALYYALNLDHFQRFPLLGVPWDLVVPLMRVSTQIARAWEVWFPLVLVGVFLRMALREPLPTLRPWVARIIRWGWLTVLVTLLAIVAWLPRELGRLDRAADPLDPEALFVPILVILVVGSWFIGRVHRRPVLLHWRGTTRALDLAWFGRWILGRRIWLSLGVVFHLHLIVFMNIGWFSPIMLSAYLCFFSGEEVVTVARAVGLPATPVAAPEHSTTDPRRNDPAKPPIEAGPLSGVVLLLAWLVLTAGLVMEATGMLSWEWSLAATLSLLVGATASRTRRANGLVRRGSPGGSERELGRVYPRPDWLAYGPWGRLGIGILVAYHLMAVTAWLLPDRRGFEPWVDNVRRPFRTWLKTTHTTQAWEMFAPNPPRNNMFLRVMVTDRDGSTWDLQTDMYSEERRPVPWIAYSRERKINRRLVGAEDGGNKYRKWHARYVCRRWALDHHGQPPVTVRLQRVTYPVLPAEVAVAGRVPDPIERLRNTMRIANVLTVRCAQEPDGQLPEHLRQRHGLGSSESPVHRFPAVRQRKAAWNRRKQD